ncbi:MAG: hypothetical protein A2521_13030 [Deltaproteobacteria bacterium RIFOXYD12_FULL_57_12]|nr:MAG: hypothetical protein A2521_13030 [Deltaproteobacteria bacterium RIFOXYD12_FULL_57_12]
MPELILPAETSRQLAVLYAEMEIAYDRVARQLDFSCAGCPDNCCDSYFLHHTYIEWAYLWEGIKALPETKQSGIIARAVHYELEATRLLAKGERPNLLCPLNEAGLCGLYAHRLLICRLHGVPAKITRPDGHELRFPGCFRCQELAERQPNPPELDRTDFFRWMVEMESAFIKSLGQALPRVKMTLAGMLAQGPPCL